MTADRGTTIAPQWPALAGAGEARADAPVLQQRGIMKKAPVVKTTGAGMSDLG